MQNFENYLCERNDTIDNAAYCHPFYHEVDKLPCYLGDRCDNPHCIFKSDPDYRKAPSSVMDMDIEERG